MRALAHLCTSDIIDYFSLGEDFANASIYKTMRDMALPLDDVAPDCKFGRLFSSCDWFLKPSVTDEGVCFTFNALNSNEIYTNEYVCFEAG